MVIGPTGDLPPLPSWLPDGRQSAGCGEHEPPPRPIVAGEGRHPDMRDFVTRLLRGGIVDRRRIIEHLRLEFDLSCAPEPAPTRGYFKAWGDWAAQSKIAERERRREPEPPSDPWAEPTDPFAFAVWRARR